MLAYDSFLLSIRARQAQLIPVAVGDPGAVGRPAHRLGLARVGNHLGRRVAADPRLIDGVTSVFDTVEGNPCAIGRPSGAALLLGRIVRQPHRRVTGKRRYPYRELPAIFDSISYSGSIRRDRGIQDDGVARTCKVLRTDH